MNGVTLRFRKRLIRELSGTGMSGARRVYATCATMSGRIGVSPTFEFPTDGKRTLAVIRARNDLSPGNAERQLSLEFGVNRGVPRCLR